MDPSLKPDSEQPQENTSPVDERSLAGMDTGESGVVNPAAATVDYAAVAADPALQSETATVTASAAELATSDTLSVSEDGAMQSIAPADPAPSLAPVAPSSGPAAADAAILTATAPADAVAPIVVSSDDAVTSIVSAAAGLAAAPVSGGSKKGRRKLFVLVTIAALVLLSGGYTFAFYLPNTPGNVYKSGLSNTGKALDKLISYTKSQDAAGYKSTALSGTMKLKSPDVSADVSLESAFDKNSNGTLRINANVLGEKATAEIRSVTAADNASPDLYVRVSGIKDYLDSLGLTELGLDGQWISIDHTIFDTISANLEGDTKSDVGNEVANASGLPTADQLNEAADKVQAINKQYLFTTDSSKAVLTNEEFIARETKNGRSANHYKVGYDKAHLQAYVAALKTTLDSSQLNDWSKKTNHGKSLSDVLDLNSLQDSVKHAKSDYTFDLWVDTKTKLVSSLRFVNPTDAAVFTVGQNYTGGTSYPFTLALSNSPDGNGSLGLVVDTKTHKYTLDLATTPGTKSSNNTTFTGKFTVTPSNDRITVSAPSGAESINDVLNALGLGGIWGDTSDTPPMEFPMVQARAEDTERQVDVSALQGQIEAYYAMNGVYPTLADINTASWRATNVRGLDREALKDPAGSTYDLASAPQAKQYAYTVVGENGQACDNRAAGCTAYTLTATLNSGETYQKSNLN